MNVCKQVDSRLANWLSISIFSRSCVVLVLNRGRGTLGIYTTMYVSGGGCMGGSEVVCMAKVVCTKDKPKKTCWVGN